MGKRHRRLISCSPAPVLFVSAALAFCLNAVASVDADPPLRLVKHTTRHYSLFTNLPSGEAAYFGRHMDAAFDQYSKQFREFKSNSNRPMSLYLFRTREQYLRHIQGHGINAANTGGIFFIRENIRGLATWVHGQPRSRTLSVLQHEGFHQFAFDRFESRLPVWANEGLAQLFEDGVLVGKRMVFGLGNARRIERVKRAIKSGAAIDFDKMLNMSDKQWRSAVIAGGERSALLYDQAWSMAYYMVSTRKKRSDAFAKYLKLLGKGRGSDTAFEQVFGQNMAAFRRGWQKFALETEPDAVNTAAERLEFLGRGLIMLRERGEKMPLNISELRARLQRYRFRLQVSSHGNVTEYNAEDEENFYFRHPNGTRGKFIVRKSFDRKFPPTITAPGLNPIPTLVWSRNSDGQLAQDIGYR